MSLHHWSDFTKMTLTLVIIIMPFCFVIIACMAFTIIKGYNRLAIHFYDKKIEKL